MHINALFFAEYFGYMNNPIAGGSHRRELREFWAGVTGWSRMLGLWAGDAVYSPFLKAIPNFINIGQFAKLAFLVVLALWVVNRAIT